MHQVFVAVCRSAQCSNVLGMDLQVSFVVLRRSFVIGVLEFEASHYVLDEFVVQGVILLIGHEHQGQRYQGRLHFLFKLICECLHNLDWRVMLGVMIGWIAAVQQLAGHPQEPFVHCEAALRVFVITADHGIVVELLAMLSLFLDPQHSEDTVCVD